VSRAPRDLTAVRGLSVGQATSDDGRSGVTVVRFASSVPTAVDVRGGASATYDTASLSLDATYGGRWAIFLAGGSVFGLDAARGVRNRILETGGGHRAFRNPIPIAPVSGAALFDLPQRREEIPDYAELGYEATRVAHRRRIAVGSVGAGAGATVGKYRGRRWAMRGGVGSAARPWGRGAVGVLLAVNSVGAVRDPSSGRWVAGARGPNGRVVPPGPGARPRYRAGGTTLTVVATDLILPRPALARVASIAHSGLARSLVPYQTSTDGDVVFAVSTGAAGPAPVEARPGENADRVGVLAAECAVEAVLAAVRSSNSRPAR
jgi:L-aminopeptidase/D-esterase-like protein